MGDASSDALESADTAVAARNVATSSSTRQNNSESDATMVLPKTPIQQRLLNSESPIPIINTTTTPKGKDSETAGTPSPPQGKNYKILYKEVTKRLFEQTKHGKERYLELQATYNEMEKKYDNDRATYEAAIEDQRKKLAEKEKTIVEKEKTIADLEEKLANEKTCVPLKRICSEDELVRLKPKRSNTKKGSVNEDQHICEFPECGQKDVDLTKCNSCGKWVCEACNEISASKLKQITNKCKRVYFLCKTCEEDVGSPCAASMKDMTPGDSNLVTTLQKMFEKKVNQLETKIEKVIDKKLGDKIEKIEKQADANPDKVSYSKILQVPSEVRKVIEEAKNDEKVELSEQEKRSQNFIIHGAEEIGDTAEEVTKNDADYINDILKTLGVREKPESIARLGKPNESKGRVLKICMKTKAGKEMVMTNLRKLKGTEDEFGKISVTEDYTKTEREEIRKFTIKAKEQQQNDSTRVYKVRGDPKNGLRVISYKK